MILFLIAYLGGVLTILSPCILPVLPFVFARANKPFLRNGLPMLIGMALMFAIVATLAALGGSWAVATNRYGRIAALVLLAFFGLTLLLPRLADRVTRPLVGLGDRLSQRTGEGGLGASLLLGIATGLLWAPCAGPILGLVLTGAALGGASARTSLLLLAYAAGAATSLALALLVGGRVFQAMKRSIGVGERVRQVLGALVLAGVAAIALGADTGVLSRLSTAGTSQIEQGLLDRFGAGQGTANTATAELADLGAMPSLAGATTWINSPPLDPAGLRGKVVLVDFWTYSCINCLRSLPYVEAWAKKYRDRGLVVIGVHTPEFAFEKDEANVRAAVQRLGIDYPVAMDNDYAVWRAFRNHYWPAHYFIDARGRVRYRHFGEGDYDQSERVIRALLAEAHGAPVANGPLVSVAGAGVEAASTGDVRSPETYVGYLRAARFAGGVLAHDTAHAYQPAADLPLNGWTLGGTWTDAAQSATATAGATLAYRFHARDLHLVLGTTGKPVRFRVTIDGKPPGDDHGTDTDAAGNGRVDGQRLYQLVRQQGRVRDRTFEIEFLDPGAMAYSFTFG
jgi:cytochrome c biogenesis protein CcdA/thiol-disulfide isomerase/thioredoxin